jgi:hypothetical protein
MTVFDGEWLYLWPMNGWVHVDCDAMAVDATGMGFGGVILHDGTNIAHEVWGSVDRIDPFTKRNLKVALGIGYPKLSGADPHALADAVVAALNVPGVAGVVNDAEGGAEGHGDVVTAMVDQVLAAVPDAASRCTWVPFASWKTDAHGHGTHPRWPAREAARLACCWRPQVYGAPTPGATMSLLKWARDPSQYASASSPPLPVDACVQGYKRKVSDHASLYMAEANSFTWNALEMDHYCRCARAAKVALNRRGFSGATGIAAFQASAGLTADGLVGPNTCKALGVAYPSAP